MESQQHIRDRSTMGQARRFTPDCREFLPFALPSALLNLWSYMNLYDLIWVYQTVGNPWKSHVTHRMSHKLYMKSPDDQMISKIYKIHCSIRVQPHLHSTFSRAMQPTNRTKAVRWSWAMLSDAEPSWSSVGVKKTHMAFMGYSMFMMLPSLKLTVRP